MSIHFGWPQIIFVTLTILGLGLALGKDGEPKTGNHSFGVSLTGSVLTLGLLYWGGFFG